MTAPLTTRPRSFMAAVLAVISLIVALASPASAAGPVVLDHGHVDIFNVSASGNQLTMTVKEDITGHGVLRAPEDVVLTVRQEALTNFSGDFSRFGTNGYALPLVQDPQLLWPGWDTQGVVAGGFDAVDIVFEEVTGPGTVYLFTQGSGLGGGVAPLLEDGQMELRSGSIRRQDPPAHTHAYWIFSAPGTYTMKVFARAGSAQTATHTYTWKVGGTADSGSGGNDDVAPTTSQQPTVSSSATTTPSSTTVLPPAVNILNDPWLNTDAGSSSSSSGSRPVVLTTVTRAHPVAERATTTVGHDHSGHNHGHDHSGHNHGHDHSGHGHTHGPAEGSRCHAVTTGGTPALVAIVRDDSVSPARDVSPESLTFVLGDNAKATTKDTLGAISPGTDVWMIGSTQVAGVPWVGVNTMNPTLTAATDAPVRISLTGFTGPGDMEVFTSGNFGTVVGQRWFSATGGTPSGHVDIPVNTHVHPNWVFTKPGDYSVGLTQEVTTRDGRTLTVPATLRFAVGTAGQGATSGHFDFGAAVSNSGHSTVMVDDEGRPCDGADFGDTSSGSVGSSPAANTERRSVGSSLAGTGLSETALPLMFAALSIIVLGGAIAVTRLHKA